MCSMAAVAIAQPRGHVICSMPCAGCVSAAAARHLGQRCENRMTAQTERCTPIVRWRLVRSTAMRIERIAITGDVFRTTNGDPNQLFNARWLRDELADVLHDLTGLTPEVGYRRNAADDGRALVTEWFGLLGHEPSAE